MTMPVPMPLTRFSDGLSVWNGSLTALATVRSLWMLTTAPLTRPAAGTAGVRRGLADELGASRAGVPATRAGATPAARPSARASRRAVSVQVLVRPRAVVWLDRMASLPVVSRIVSEFRIRRNPPKAVSRTHSSAAGQLPLDDVPCPICRIPASPPGRASPAPGGRRGGRVGRGTPAGGDGKRWSDGVRLAAGRGKSKTIGTVSRGAKGMSDKTRRQKLEAMLASDATDPVLRYSLAMEYVSAGDHETAVQQFRVLIENPPKPYVPAYLMCAQSLVKLAKPVEAVMILKEGIPAAKKLGDRHAVDEMKTLLESLEE